MNITINFVVKYNILLNFKLARGKSNQIISRDVGSIKTAKETYHKSRRIQQYFST